MTLRDMRPILLAVSGGAVAALIHGLLVPRSVTAHSGGLDSSGCQNDRQRGGYHCHQGPLAGQSFGSAADAAAALRARNSPAPAPELRAVPQVAPVTGLAFLCSDISGNYMGAPDWRTEPDRLTGQQVLLHFKGEGQLGEVVWSTEGKEYSRGPALGVSMKSGFALVVLADDRIEMYVYSAATTEFLFSQTRAGSNLLPNVVKSYHGRCKPAGSQVQK